MTDEVIATETPADEPAPARIVYQGVREKMIPLEYPVEFNGQVYEAIKIRRASGKEVREYLQALQNSEADILPPMIDCPIEVWHALDADDHEAVDLAAMEFTPKRLKAIFDAAVKIDVAAKSAT